MLRALERVAGESKGGWVPITWDEAELLEANLIAKDGPADTQALGVTPQKMSAVLEAG
jgi:hypothetical protein